MPNGSAHSAARVAHSLDPEVIVAVVALPGALGSVRGTPVVLAPHAVAVPALASHVRPALVLPERDPRPARRRGPARRRARRLLLGRTRWRPGVVARLRRSGRKPRGRPAPWIGGLVLRHPGPALCDDLPGNGDRGRGRTRRNHDERPWICPRAYRDPPGGRTGADAVGPPARPVSPSGVVQRLTVTACTPRRPRIPSGWHRLG